MVSTLEAQMALTAHDRCDRCGAQAVARATLSSGSHLLFCGHHLRAHEARLRQVARIDVSRSGLQQPGSGELTSAE